MRDLLDALKKPNSISWEDIRDAAAEIILNTSGKKGSIDLLTPRGAGPSEGELALRNRLAWLKTIPLCTNESFVALHKESGVYMDDKKRNYSADLLGLHRKKNAATRLAVAELKYCSPKSSGDNLMYAYAEGMRNLALHLQGIDRLKAGWVKYIELLKSCPPQKGVWKDYIKRFTEEEQYVWPKKNPFGDISTTGASLFIIGNHEWGVAQAGMMKRLPKNPIKLGTRTVSVSVYSTCDKTSSRSNPYMLLPLTPLK